MLKDKVLALLLCGAVTLIAPPSVPDNGAYIPKENSFDLGETDVQKNVGRGPSEEKMPFWARSFCCMWPAIAKWYYFKSTSKVGNKESGAHTNIEQFLRDMQAKRPGLSKQKND